MKLVHNIRRFWQVPAIEKKLLAKGLFLCLILIPVVNLLPLKRYIRLMRCSPKSGVYTNNKRIYIKLAGKTMRRIERFSPFRFSCLVKSMTFKLLLNSLGVESNIALGINNSQSALLKAHAFVKVENEVVYLKRKRFNEVYMVE